MFCFTCLNNNKETPDSAMPTKYLKFKVNIVNNSDLPVDFVLKKVLIGGNVLENTEDIFLSNAIYEYIKNSEPKGFKENIPISIDYFGKYDDAKIHGTIIKDNSDVLIFYDYLGESGGGVETLLLRLNFSGSNEKILAGWPKYYYSKLPNVSLYGFSYCFYNDKKNQNH